MHEMCWKGEVNELLGDKMTDIFNFLFWDDENAVILLENKEIKKMNPMAKDIFLVSDIDEFTRKMDKPSIKMWGNFLKNTTICRLATCQITIISSNQPTIVYDIEGCYNHSTDQYMIRFKQVHKVNHVSTEGLKYDAIFKYAPYGIILTSTDGTILEANQMVEAFFEMSATDLIGEDAKLIYQMLPNSQYDFSQYFKELLSKGFAKIITSKVEANGEVKFYQIHSIFNEKVDMYVTIIRDETEKVQLKKQVEHSGSLSTLGQLAASIAHEIRNPLTSLKGFTQLLTHQVTKEGSQYLEIINSELNRMESILNEFLVLSKPALPSFQCVSLSTLISQVVDFMYPQGILQNIELDFISWDQESDGIFGDAFELKKVFMNILKNAIEVMPQGGKVKITQTTTDDNQICVSIEDQGLGMTSEEMHKIFSPFYTSKDYGTGLGLAHAIQTIENHGGSIEVESELHQGTTFHILLPLFHINEMKDKTIPNYTKPDWEVITAI